MTLIRRIVTRRLGKDARVSANEDEPIMPGQQNVQIIVGLGNPGSKYAETRHNAGFFVIEELARRMQAPPSRKRFHAVIQEARLGDRRFVLVQPQTYMNDSGLAVREIVNWYRAPHDQVLIVVDDLDQPFGQIRLRAKGSAGGHNGLKSIFSQLGSSDVPRLRIGIGRGPNQTIAHVLSRFSPEERAELDDVIGRAADDVMLWSERGALEAMNLINGADKIKAREENRVVNERPS
jgi:PTH1 family peptidyl-tRNA hydrolase